MKHFFLDRGGENGPQNFCFILSEKMYIYLRQSIIIYFLMILSVHYNKWLGSFGGDCSDCVPIGLAIWMQMPLASDWINLHRLHAKLNAIKAIIAFIRWIDCIDAIINPFVPSVFNIVRLTKISILILEGILKKKKIPMRRAYESVDEKSLSWAMSRKTTKKESGHKWVKEITEKVHVAQQINKKT